MDGFILLPIALAVILGVSAVAKLRQPADIESAFSSLDLPRALNRTWIRISLPIGELILAAGLLVASGWLAVLIALATLFLMIAYMVVIGRALTFDYPVTCGCFGRIGFGAVTTKTLARNIILVIMAAGTLWRAIADDHSVFGVIADRPEVIAWIMSASLIAAVAILIATPGQQVAEVAPVVDDGEYVRQPTPLAALVSPEGRAINIRDLARAQAHVLVFVSPGCGFCRQAIELIDELKGHIGHIAIRYVFPVDADQAQSLIDNGQITSTAYTYFDPRGFAGAALGANFSPSAVVLGTDDYLAGGPVTGFDNVKQMIDDIRAELAEADLDGVDTPPV